MSLLSRGFRYMVAAGFFFALMSALVKVGGQRFPTMQLVLARSLVVLVLSTWALRRAGTRFGGREPKLLLTRGVLGFIALTCFYYAIVHLPLAEATVIQYTNPVWTALVAAVVLGEWIGARQVTLALVSLGGVVMVARPAGLIGGGAGLDPLAVAVALGGAVFSAAAYVTVRRLRREATMVVVFWFAAVSVVLSLPGLALGAVWPRGTEWLLLLAIGVSTHLGQVFLTLGLRHEAAGRAMAVGYLQIVFAGVWGFALFGDVPDRWALGGTAVIVGATLALARMRSPEPKADPEG